MPALRGHLPHDVPKSLRIVTLRLSSKELEGSADMSQLIRRQISSERAIDVMEIREICGAFVTLGLWRCRGGSRRPVAAMDERVEVDLIRGERVAEKAGEARPRADVDRAAAQRRGTPGPQPGDPTVAA